MSPPDLELDVFDDFARLVATARALPAGRVRWAGAPGAGAWRARWLDAVTGAAPPPTCALPAWFHATVPATLPEAVAAAIGAGRWDRAAVGALALGERDAAEALLALDPAPDAPGHHLAAALVAAPVDLPAAREHARKLAGREREIADAALLVADPETAEGATPRLRALGGHVPLPEDLEAVEARLGAPLPAEAIVAVLERLHRRDVPGADAISGRARLGRAGWPIPRALAVARQDRPGATAASERAVADEDRRAPDRWTPLRARALLELAGDHVRDGHDAAAAAALAAFDRHLPDTDWQRAEAAPLAGLREALGARLAGMPVPLPAALGSLAAARTGDDVGYAVAALAAADADAYGMRALADVVLHRSRREGRLPREGLGVLERWLAVERRRLVGNVRDAASALLEGARRARDADVEALAHDALGQLAELRGPAAGHDHRVAAAELAPTAVRAIAAALGTPGGAPAVRAAVDALADRWSAPRDAARIAVARASATDDPEVAAADLERALAFLARDPTPPDGAAWLGPLRTVARGDAVRALRLLEQLVHVPGTAALPWAGRFAVRELRRIEVAEQWATAGLTDPTTTDPARLLLAEVRRAQGRRGEAYALLDEVRPDGPWAEELEAARSR